MIPPQIADLLRAEQIDPNEIAAYAIDQDLCADDPRLHLTVKFKPNAERIDIMIVNTPCE